MRRTFGVIVFCLLVALTALGQSTLVLYDNFNGTRINPVKWSNASETSFMREAVRQLDPSYQGEGNNRRLHILAQSYSWTGDDSGQTWNWLGLRFANESSLKEVSFDVLVTSAALSSCGSNPSWLGTVGAQFRGRFFNTGIQNSDVDDVEAGISVERAETDARAPLTIWAFYYKGDGSVGDSLYVGTVPLGKTFKLRMKWDQLNHRFVAQLNNNPETVISYSFPDTAPPTTAYKAIQVTPGTPNCTTAPAASATMDAYFDNVYVNAY